MIRKMSGFTLIELLVVVAIIAILAPIAVPNFLEAQMRAKVSRSLAVMRSIVTAMEAYRVDNNDVLVPDYPDVPMPGDGMNWWGFVPASLTTPVSYMTAVPIMTFLAVNDSDVVDLAVETWVYFMGGTPSNLPYTYAYDVGIFTGTQQVTAHGIPDSTPTMFRTTLSPWRTRLPTSFGPVASTASTPLCGARATSMTPPTLPPVPGTSLASVQELQMPAVSKRSVGSG